MAWTATGRISPSSGTATCKSWTSPYRSDAQRRWQPDVDRHQSRRRVRSGGGRVHRQPLGDGAESRRTGQSRRTWPLAFTAIRVQYEEIFGGNTLQLLASAPPLVRAAYVIPSNRTPQPDGVENLQHSLRLFQDWFRDQMDRNGFGSKTLRIETESDGVTPAVHVVSVDPNDEVLRKSLGQHQYGRNGSRNSPLGRGTGLAAGPRRSMSSSRTDPSRVWWTAQPSICRQKLASSW